MKTNLKNTVLTALIASVLVLGFLPMISTMTGQENHETYESLNEEKNEIYESMNEENNEIYESPNEENNEIYESPNEENNETYEIYGRKYLGEWDDDEWIYEEGLEGWNIILKQEENDDWVEIANTTTDEYGRYNFTDLSSGEYRVYEELKENWKQVYPTDPEYHSVSLPGGEGREYKFVNAEDYEIYGRKYLWEYQDGEWFYEEGLEGWNIILKQEENDDWVEIANTTTDEYGRYHFTDLSSGEYRVYEELKENWKQVYPTDPEYHSVSLPGGEGREYKFVNARNETPLTPGYWKTHSEYGPAGYDETWDEIGEYGEDTEFFLSEQSYIEVLWTPPRGGNAYYILAHAYIAAELNFLNGVYAPSEIRDAFDEATYLFEEYTPEEVGRWRGNQGQRQDFIELAGILDDFNNGHYHY